MFGKTPRDVPSVMVPLMVKVAAATAVAIPVPDTLIEAPPLVWSPTTDNTHE
jgi:hypothetical protein